jgi:hypothetical protein
MNTPARLHEKGLQDAIDHLEEARMILITLGNKAVRVGPALQGEAAQLFSQAEDVVKVQVKARGLATLVLGSAR